MAYAATKIYTIILLVFIISAVQAFNIKNMLFGNKEHVNDESTIPFGTPMMEKQTSNRADIPCKHYICEYTETCVLTPFDCPCRLQTDIKCPVGDWYMCVRGGQSCQNLQ